MNTIKDKTTFCHWCFQSNLIRDSKGFSINSSALTLISIFMLSFLNALHVLHYCLWHLSDILRLLMMSFKYGVTLLRYSSADSVLLLSLLLSYSI